MLNNHYLKENKSLQIKIFKRISNHYLNESIAKPERIKRDTGECEDFTKTILIFKMEEVEYCGADLIYCFPHRNAETRSNYVESISEFQKKQIEIDVLSAITNYSSQFLCWLRPDSQIDSIKILIDIGFEVLLESKNANSGSKIKLLCFDWLDDDCCSKIEKFMSDEADKK